ncbi:MAG: MarR family transcriptional regulator [Planctomyces sp.]|nr:MarR family transcriptional regulator [Planctomyces sp.]
MAAKKSTSNLHDHAGYWLRYVSNHVSHAFAQKVEAQGVTVAEWVLLRQIFEAVAANPSQLAVSLGMTRGAISKLIERLCRKHLVSRSYSGDDRRFQSVELTPAGKRLVPVLARLADENDHEFFGHLNAEERMSLIDILQNIVRQHAWKDLPVE